MRAITIEQALKQNLISIGEEYYSRVCESLIEKDRKNLPNATIKLVQGPSNFSGRQCYFIYGDKTYLLYKILERNKRFEVFKTNEEERINKIIKDETEKMLKEYNKMKKNYKEALEEFSKNPQLYDISFIVG